MPCERLSRCPSLARALSPGCRWVASSEWGGPCLGGHRVGAVLQAGPAVAVHGPAAEAACSRRGRRGRDVDGLRRVLQIQPGIPRGVLNLELSRGGGEREELEGHGPPSRSPVGLQAEPRAPEARGVGCEGTPSPRSPAAGGREGTREQPNPTGLAVVPRASGSPHGGEGGRGPRSAGPCCSARGRRGAGLALGPCQSDTQVTSAARVGSGGWRCAGCCFSECLPRQPARSLQRAAPTAASHRGARWAHRKLAGAQRRPAAPRAQRPLLPLPWLPVPSVRPLKTALWFRGALV